MSLVAGYCVDLVGHESVGLAVNRDGVFCGLRLNEAENLAFGFVNPVLSVFDPVLALGIKVLLVGGGGITCRYAAFERVHVHKQ